MDEICCWGMRSSSSCPPPAPLPSSSSYSAGGGGGGGIQHSYPRLVIYDNDCRPDTDHIFFNTLPQNSHNVITSDNHHHSRIPQLAQKQIHGSFHGWLVLSKYPPDSYRLLDFSLWNPVTKELISLPRLKLKKSLEDDDPKVKLAGDIISCCLSAPPFGRNSFLLLTRLSKPNLALCLLSNEKKFRWLEVSYASVVRNMSHIFGLFRNVLDDSDDEEEEKEENNNDIDDFYNNGKFICQTVFCNGNVYAGCIDFSFIMLDIEVTNKDEARIRPEKTYKGRQVSISFKPCGIFVLIINTIPT